MPLPSFSFFLALVLSCSLVLSDIALTSPPPCPQLLFVANIFYAAAIAFTKLSIIASYMHIFTPQGPFKIMLYATACVTAGLCLASIPATIFECIPVAGAWNVTEDNATCYTFVNFLFPAPPSTSPPT